MEQKQTLEQMVSQHVYDEIVENTKKMVGEKAFDFVFPAIKKALEEGDREVREEILISFLDCDSCRVCTECGKIMSEGWYNMGQYACSDECVIKQDGITKEEFDRFSIFKSTIQHYLDDEGEGRQADDLSDEEIKTITDELLENSDAYYTEWY